MILIKTITENANMRSVFVMIFHIFIDWKPAKLVTHVRKHGNILLIPDAEQVSSSNSEVMKSDPKQTVKNTITIWMKP